MSKSNSPMNSDLMHETAMSEHVIQRVSKSPCIYVVHRYSSMSVACPSAIKSTPHARFQM